MQCVCRACACVPIVRARAHFFGRFMSAGWVRKRDREGRREKMLSSQIFPMGKIARPCTTTSLFLCLHFSCNFWLLGEEIERREEASMRRFDVFRSELMQGKRRKERLSQTDTALQKVSEISAIKTTPRRRNATEKEIVIIFLLSLFFCLTLFCVSNARRKESTACKR